jgi:DNA-binding LytR/AlgR family response regulator
MRVLIIEDENIASDRLIDMLKEVAPGWEVLGVLDSIEASVDFFKKGTEADLIFMDIELGDGQSFEIFLRVTVDAPVVFITAYQEHTLKAFKHNSIDYLLKPLNKEELRMAIAKFQKLQTLQKKQLQKNILALLESQSVPVKNTKDRFLAKNGTRLISVETTEIAYFYTKEKFQYLKTINDTDYIIDKSLDDIEKELDSKAFFRANRQFIISYKSIEKVHAWFSGKLKVQVIPKSYEEIIVSRLRAADCKKWLGE